MLVILKQDVKGTGRAGEIVKVSDGYARNMLIPKGLAVEATKGNMNNLEKAREKQAEEEAAAKKAAEELAKKLAGLTITVKTKAGEGGRLFGSITSMDISEELEKQHGIHVDKRRIQMDQPIKQLGDFKVPAKLHHDVNAELTVKVEE